MSVEELWMLLRELRRRVDRLERLLDGSVGSWG